MVKYDYSSEVYPDVTFDVELKRKSKFYVANMILPSFLISILGVLGFFIPPEAGEKVALAITLLLSQFVFLFMVGEKLPPSSETLPLLGEYH